MGFYFKLKIRDHVYIYFLLEREVLNLKLIVHGVISSYRIAMTRWANNHELLIHIFMNSLTGRAELLTWHVKIYLGVDFAYAFLAQYKFNFEIEWTLQLDKTWLTIIFLQNMCYTCIEALIWKWSVGQRLLSHFSRRSNLCLMIELRNSCNERIVSLIRNWQRYRVSAKHLNPSQ